MITTTSLAAPWRARTRVAVVAVMALGCGPSPTSTIVDATADAPPQADTGQGATDASLEAEAGTSVPNAAPTVIWTSPEAGSVVTLGRAALFRAQVQDDTTAPGDLALSLAIAPGPHGAISLAIAEDGSVSFAIATLPAGAQALTLTAWDAQGDSGAATVNVLVDAPPSAPTVSIQPVRPTTTDALTVVTDAPALDPETGPLAETDLRYRWYRNGELVPDMTDRVVQADRTTSGETWRVVVRGDDGATSGIETSASATIDNAAPLAPTIGLEPSAPSVASTVTCVISAPSTDPDGDDVVTSLRWSINGVEVPEATGSATLALASKEAGVWVPHFPFEAGDVLTCLASGDDGGGLGPAAEAAATLLAFDPCADGAGGCPARTQCVPSNTAAAACPCATGYDTLADGSCFDVDECAGTSVCGAHAMCENNDGGYACACEAGWREDTTAGGGCVDLDECLEGTATCDLAADCVNTAGGYQCWCSAGYLGDGKKAGGCVDIDECDAGLALCGPLGQCVNSTGGYQCVCPEGFAAGDESPCADVDECADGTATCDELASCTNTAGGFACVCAPGFEGDGATCADIDECSDEAAECGLGARCVNTVGTYDCVCLPGFTADGAACVDVDECLASAAGCSADADCVNTDGGRSCACRAGFEGDGLGLLGCDDLDECALGVAVCGIGAACQNLDGGYECACLPGFVGDGVLCADIDECADGTALCDGAATCLNTDGSYACVCKPGWVGDGHTCAPAVP